MIEKVGEEVMRSIKIAGLILSACLITALPVSAHGWHHGGRIAVVPSFGYWGWYSPYYYGNYWPYGYYSGVYSNLGEVKIRTNVKDAEVYINGAYAGNVRVPSAPNQAYNADADKKSCLCGAPEYCRIKIGG